MEMRIYAKALIYIIIEHYQGGTMKIGKNSLNLSIKKKLVIVATILLVVPTLFLGIKSYKYAKSELDLKGQIVLQNAVDLAINLIDEKQKQVDRGLITKEEAQEQMKVFLIGEKNKDSNKRELKNTIYLGDKGYFAVYDKEGNEVAHPILEGKNVWNEKSKGKDSLYLVQDCIKKGEQGGGFTYYHWELPGEDTIEEKIAYTKLDPNWGWYVSASSYMSSFNSGAEKVWKGLIYTLIIAMFIGIIIIIILSNRIAKPIVELSRYLKMIEDERYDIEVPQNFLKRKDEIGMLSRVINSMSSELLENINKLNEKNTLLAVEIKERKKVELRLLLTLEILENSKEAIFIASKNDNEIIYINKAFSFITGYTEKEVLNNNIESFIGDSYSVYEEIFESLEESGTWIGELYQVNKSGQRYPVLLSIKSIKNTTNKEDYYIAIFEDLTRIKEKEESINYLRKYDTLTALPQKALFIDKLDKIINDNKNISRVIGIMTLGLDDFKFINEAIGHSLGDMLLVQVAERLREHINSRNLLARITGDEFAILLDDIKGIDQVTNVANNILKVFSTPFNIQDRELFITASIGISIYPVHGINAETLIMNAISAQNHVKKNGKNNYQIYSKKMNEDAYETLEMITSLRHAVEREEFILHYQQQVSLKTGSIIGFEALIRWNHPKLGMVYPDKFISLAEKTGTIVAMSEWVIKEACRQNKEWHDKGYNTVVVSVNLSAMQFKKRDLAKTIKDILDFTGLPAKYLEVEITEGILMEDVVQGIEIISELKAIGVTIAVDDFGTGYSSLNYLRQFQIDKLKIDRSFIMGIPETDDGSIANIIIELAKSFNLKVIAEGAETLEHINFLRDRNCDEIQGYYFSKPVTKDISYKMLSGNKRLD